MRSNRRLFEKVFKYICMFGTFFAILTLIVLLYHLFKEGWEWVDTQFLTSYQSRFAHKAGIKAGIYGTLWLISVTAVVSIPLGVLSAIFLEEYGIKGRLGKIVEINVSNLAGVPSIVYGLLGLAVFVRYFGMGNSVLAAGCTLALLILPVIIVSARESIRAVPNSIRFGAYALGAEKRHVVFGQVLPAALPGILTGIILALSRAIGETAPLIIVGALTYVSFTPESIMDEFTVLPIQIYNWASRPKIEFHGVAAGGIVVLISTMLVMNFIAVIIRHKSQKRNRL